MLIVLGIVLLLRNLGITSLALDNWWALFILIPAVGALNRAWRQYQTHDRRITPYARKSLITGFVLMVVTVVLLFDLDWRFALPILLILAGIGALLGTMDQ